MSRRQRFDEDDIECDEGDAIPEEKHKRQRVDAETDTETEVATADTTPGADADRRTWADEWSSGAWPRTAEAVLLEVSPVAVPLARLVVDYCSPFGGAIDFEVRFEMTCYRRIECPRRLRVGDVMIQYVRELEPIAGLTAALLPLERFLPNLHRHIGLAEPPLPRQIVLSPLEHPKPHWMETRFAIAAFVHGVAWPPWPRPCYSINVWRLGPRELAAFARDPFNGQVLGAWNNFGSGSVELGDASLNFPCNLVGLTEPQDPAMRALWDARLPGEDVLWVNRHAFLAATADVHGASIHAGAELIYRRRERHLIGWARPLAIVNGRTDAVDELYSRVYESAEEARSGAMPVVRPIAGAALPVLLASLPAP